MCMGVCAVYAHGAKIIQVLLDLDCAENVFITVYAGVISVLLLRA